MQTTEGGIRLAIRLALGLSYIFAFNIAGSPLLHGSAFLLALCNFYHYPTQGFLAMVTGMRAVPPALEEAATCLASGAVQVLANVIVPVMAPTLVAVFFFLSMRSMATLSAVIYGEHGRCVGDAPRRGQPRVAGGGVLDLHHGRGVHRRPRHAWAAGAAVVATRAVRGWAPMLWARLHALEASEGCRAEAHRARAEHAPTKYRKQPHAQ